MIIMDMIPDAGEKLICDERLWAFIQGHVDPAEALLIATHCCLCPRASMRLTQLMSCAASVMENDDTQAMQCSGAEFFARNCTDVPVEPGQGVTVNAVPKPLQALCGQSFDALAWWQNARGFHELALVVPGSQLSLGLYKITQGFQIPEHTHIQDELGLVLMGQIREEGRIFNTGDISVRQAGGKYDRHAPVALTDVICMIVYG